ncbi:MAG: amino acid racemase, partial [Gammaproteobacteria bacterium]|nr:amino acid racemase [Gammaproteobacteria bacterium]
RHINEAVKARLGRLHSAQLVLVSVDFQPIEQMQSAGQWQAAGEQLAACARGLAAAGAGCIVICANTMHKVAPMIEAAVRLPLLHVTDATGAAIGRAGLARIGLLGTRYTMAEPFYTDRLRERFALDVLVPGDADRAEANRIIFEELVLGRVLESSRVAMRGIMARLVDRGAQGIILGCTEFSLLIGDRDASVPLFDTTLIHARAAVDWALDGAHAAG